jgi:hypothetical protein
MLVEVLLGFPNVWDYDIYALPQSCPHGPDPWRQFAEQTRQKNILTIKRLDHVLLLAAFAHLVILGALTVRHSSRSKSCRRQSSLSIIMSQLKYLKQMVIFYFIFIFKKPK